MNEILHIILDVLSGRRNLPAHEADALHEQLDPGYTVPKDSPEAVAAAQELVARHALAAAYQASQAAAAVPAEPAPAAEFVPPVQ